MDQRRRDLSQFYRLLIHPAFRSAPKECSAARRQSATISYSNSYRLGYWREKCPSGSAGLTAEATGRAAPTAVGEPETKAYLRAEREVRIQFPPVGSLQTFGSVSLWADRLTDRSHRR